MSRRLCLFLIALLSLAVSFIQADDRLPLGRAEIVVDPSEPSFVQYGVEELAAYLKELTGVQPPVRGAVSDADADHILVGSKAVESVFPQALSEAKIEGEGYLLRVTAKDKANYVIASGISPHGTKAAMGALLKTIRCDGKKISLPSQLNTVGKPPYAKRGIHLNGWPLAYPYTFRSWTEQDWQRYLDILACQNVNVFYLWPFIEIMPVPPLPRRSGVSGGMPPRGRLCAEEAWHGGVDHAMHQPRGQGPLRRRRPRVCVPIGGPLKRI